MFPIFETPALFTDLNRRSKELLLEIIPKLALPGTPRVIKSGEVLTEGIFFVEKGALACVRKETEVLLLFEEGDLVDTRLYGVIPDATLGARELEALGRFYTPSEWAQALQPEAAAKVWRLYSGHQSQLFLLMTVSLFQSGDRQWDPQLRNYLSGDFIIGEGQPANEVFTLVEGHADVFVESVKVGEIQEDEIFGALAALTQTPRSATVRATKDCTVLAIPTENFIELIQSRPQTILKMMQSMARTIISLNESVLRHKRGVAGG